MYYRYRYRYTAYRARRKAAIDVFLHLIGRFMLPDFYFFFLDGGPSCFILFTFWSPHVSGIFG